MSAQRDLFDPYTQHPMARRRDPDSSHVAATQLERSGKAGTQRDQVHAAVRCYPGYTSRQLSDATKLDYHMVARRLPELENEGRILATGRRRCNAAHPTGPLRWFPKLDDNDD